MKNVQASAEAIAGVNVAPIINVAFVLVIVMMMMAPILDIPNIPIELPEAVTIESKEANISVSLAKDGRVSVNEEIVEWKQLPSKLNAQLKENPNIMVIVRADKDVLYSRVEELIELLKSRTRAKRLAVATKQKTQNGVQ